MITQSQGRLLTFIIDQTVKSGGVSPSYEEMREHANLKSKSGVHRLIGALEDRRFIQRTPRKARCIEILKWPNGTPYQNGQSDIDHARALGEAVMRIWKDLPQDIQERLTDESGLEPATTGVEQTASPAPSPERPSLNS